MKVLIIGGGIGGLATALTLHAAGIHGEVFEQAREIRELGVGINVLPHAVRELAALGLLDTLDRVGLRTAELIYGNRFGQTIWREPRGLDAGYAYPQLSIHRGRLQGVLHAAVEARLGRECVRTGHRLTGIAQDARGVTATFERRDGSGATVTARGDALVAADGIHSTVRAGLYPHEGPPIWSGMMLWRGAVEHPAFLTGRSMLIAGGRRTKLVLYPISSRTDRPGARLLSWAVMSDRRRDGRGAPPRREDWSRRGQLEEFLPEVEGFFHLDVLDPVEVVRATAECYEYPMCDRDPVGRWSFDRVTLLGDAAHPMYPVGSNGASQAILDASCLARVLAEAGDVVTALRAYEAIRRPLTDRIVRDNRRGGPERVIDVIEARAPGGFARLADVARHEELEAIVKGYAWLAGFAREQVRR
jgi:2-polyprenyl-6-methoxyphenol hydroxylase-like FAD-dependent oxidoreductase